MREVGESTYKLFFSDEELTVRHFQRKSHIEEQDEHLWLKSIYIFIIYFRKWPIVMLDKTIFLQQGLCRALWSCIETAIWTFNSLIPVEVHYMETNPGMFSSKTSISLMPFWFFTHLTSNRLGYKSKSIGCFHTSTFGAHPGSINVRVLFFRMMWTLSSDLGCAPESA